MASVYRARTVPAWNTPLTPTNFLATALLLGGLMVNATLLSLAGLQVTSGLPLGFRDLIAAGLTFSLLCLLLATWLCLRLWLGRRSGSPSPTRAGLLLGAAAGLALALLLLALMGETDFPRPVSLARIALVLAVAAEIKERQAFYGSYQRVGV